MPAKPSSVTRDIEDASEKREIIIEILHAKVKGGNHYVRSKNLASELGLSSKEVGVNLGFLAEEAPIEGLQIEQWGRSKSSTWYVGYED